MLKEDVIIIGGGPCGLAAAIAIKEKGYNPLIIEKGNIVNAIYHYPTHQTFFSTSEKLEIGDVSFITENRKPVRSQALAYYRRVVQKKELRIHSFEQVVHVHPKEEGLFSVESIKNDGAKNEYQAKYVVIATGYYDHPNFLEIPGEKLDKVFHYFKEAHPYFDKDIVVVGGKNSAIDAALELEKVGARVTVLYRGETYSPSIKPWILPEFESLVRQEKISMHFQSTITKITEHEVFFEKEGQEYRMKNDFVFAMTGYHPDHTFLKGIGVNIDDSSGRPFFDPTTMETNVNGVYIAGVIAAGNNANEIFIENGRFHGGLIAASIVGKTPN
ncbi:YpdA family putative bacillithiol disulfide reductase [Bacillus pinisoli]|uniref:YpdA family putative bacillithiol disulfide reductase n=1 Tax=Bacillus pinisoli TaxID=2901866 RepID=UPI001FF1578A|nr:YpdA family putative bacillithiol disulfide reductase [Bacillus pinisoli]